LIYDVLELPDPLLVPFSKTLLRVDDRVRIRIRDNVKPGLRDAILLLEILWIRHKLLILIVVSDLAVLATPEEYAVDVEAESESLLME